MKAHEAAIRVTSPKPSMHAHPMRLVLSTAVPLVAVSMALRRPSSARVGIWYLSRVVPSDPAFRGAGPSQQINTCLAPACAVQPGLLEHTSWLEWRSLCSCIHPLLMHLPAVMSTICALRWPIRSTTWPTCSSGTWWQARQ